MVDENNPLNEDEVDFIDVTEFCLMALTFIVKLFMMGFLAKRMGKSKDLPQRQARSKAPSTKNTLLDSSVERQMVSSLMTSSENQGWSVHITQKIELSQCPLKRTH